MNTYLIDTNIIIYAFNLDSEFNNQALRIMEDAINGEMKAYIADKSLYEFFAIITDSKRVEKPITVKEAIEVINFIISSNIKLIMPSYNSMNILFNLLDKYHIKKKKIFDFVLASMAIDHKIKIILTGNDKDFSVIEELNVINPFAT
ncbi:PilT protein domain protein [Caldithrix abyssi DSM 13497]|uniref:PilT protein domain protein n=2 Tax=Caldithrix abyssi DSM 13497 TaxID=880073 RepID=H1XS69_CALAY|nr:type II toxin-antitoxin system VapC family toxin [Caldithrix abyssi]EHO40233.1 PilT protein domain protein [Caldithrix abyssi DSM 13497]